MKCTREKNKLINSNSKNEGIALDSVNETNKNEQSCKSTTKQLDSIFNLLDKEYKYDVSDYSKKSRLRKIGKNVYAFVTQLDHI